MLVVELRGLHNSPDTPVKHADLGVPPGRLQPVVIDFRPQREGDRVDPQLLLQKLQGMNPIIETLAAGRDTGDVQIAAGGLAAVPALFLAGMLLDDESKVILYDWHRDAKRWQQVQGPDDGKRTAPFDITPLAPGSKDVVLAMSLSYQVDVELARTIFHGLPVVELRAQEVRADRFWSCEKQQAIVAAFRDAVQSLMAAGVNRIHLLLAAPASLCLRLGMSYDRRLMPDVLVYQFERTDSPPYPWAIRMPTHGLGTPALVMQEEPVA